MVLGTKLWQEDKFNAHQKNAYHLPKGGEWEEYKDPYLPFQIDIVNNDDVSEKIIRKSDEGRIYPHR